MSLETGIMILLILIVLLMIGYVLLIRNRINRDKQQARDISKLIVSYFGTTDLEVRVFTFRPDWDDSFMTLIETPPINRFRHSNILEGNLIEYIEKTTGQTISKVFWRFSLSINLAKADSIASYSFSQSYQLPDTEAILGSNLLDELGHPHFDPKHYEVSEISVEEFNAHINKPPKTPQDASAIKPEPGQQSQLARNSMRKTS
jgi:hypothetical protein